MRDGFVRRGIPALALVAVTACSFSGGAEDRPGPSPSGRGRVDAATTAALRAAERATERAGSVRVGATTVMGATLSTKTAGTLGWAHGSTGRLTITYTGGELAGTLRALSGTTMEARLLPDAYYAEVDEGFARRLRGRHWIRYDYADLGSLAGGSGASLTDQLRNTAPTQPVKLLLASGDVRRIGTRTVRGRRTTYYSGTVEAASLTDSALRAQLTGAGVGTETVGIWLDGRGLLVKKTERAELPSGRMSATAYYEDYGVRVSAKPPPADDTADFEELVNAEGATGPPAP